ncbi:MAG: D-alanyl-D-alanine-carboxypeptidase/endopeptidase AmpH [Devosia sp.]
MRISAAVLAACGAVGPAFANDPLLADTFEFTGQIFHLSSGVPGLVIAAVRDDESVVFGFGETEKEGGQTPDKDTKIGVGSITKTFTGMVLAHAVADGAVRLTDPAAPHVGLVGALPERDGHTIRMVDLATHASGFGRELRPVDGAQKSSDASFEGNFKGDSLLFAPGTGILYSNLGFDVLAMALSGVNGKPYAGVLQDAVLDPLGLTATGYARPQGGNVFTGHDWNGNEMDPGDPIANNFGASSLHTTPADMNAYLKWNLDRFGDTDPEARALSHAAHLIRDGLNPVYGTDESGHMNAMGLGWVIMMPEGDRPLVMQKAGGTNGVLSYIAFAPHRGVGVFISINQFDFSAGMEMADAVNDLIGTLAPR